MTQSSESDIRHRFLEGMAQAASTVTVVTTDGAAGRAGVTVSSMAPVSADAARPTLLVCLHHQTPTAELILKNGVFCVNMLRDDQSYISEVFAGRHAGAMHQRFDMTTWVDMPSGAPRVADPLVAFDCAVVGSDRIGTHHVFFGEVSEIFTAADGSPLIYANRGYGMTRGLRAPAPMAGKDSVLRMGISPAVAASDVAQLAAGFRESCPDTALDVSRHSAAAIGAALISGDIDLAVMEGGTLPEALEATPLGRVNTQAILRRGDPLAAQEGLDSADLRGLALVVQDSAMARAVDPDQTLGQIAALVPDPATLMALVARGVGIGLMRGAFASLPDGLVARPVSDLSDAGGSLVLARRALGEPGAAAAAMLALVRDQSGF